MIEIYNRRVDTLTSDFLITIDGREVTDRIRVRLTINDAGHPWWSFFEVRYPVESEKHVPDPEVWEWHLVGSLPALLRETAQQAAERYLTSQGKLS